MKLHPIETGNFKLDGGAMFGVVPKVLWQKTNPSDSNNLCPWAMRCMLVEDGDRLMLIDTGIGDKQDDKFLRHYYLHGDHSLKSSVERAGFGMDEITDVFLTHLHFDHCGGAIKRDQSNPEMLIPTFKNAKFWSTEAHWNWAVEPNAREKASFLKDNINPIEASGQLNFVSREDKMTQNVFSGVDVFFADGHTESQMIPIMNYKGHKVAFMADLLPSIGHIPLPYVMGYDTRPLLTLDEKAWFLNWCVEENVVLFLEHDHENECCTLKHTEKGVRLDKTFKLSEL